MNKATPHQHGHETDAPAGRGSHEEHGKASAEHRSHDQHEGHSPTMFRDKFWLSLALTVPVVLWSAHIQELLGYRAPVFTGSAWIPAVLGTDHAFCGHLSQDAPEPVWAAGYNLVAIPLAAGCSPRGASC